MKNLGEIIKEQSDKVIQTTNFENLSKYQGKVRDVYDLSDKLIIITTDRISAFDRVLASVPFKGAILNKTTMFWFEQTKDIIQNHIIKQIHPNAIVVKKVKILPVEIIIRGYLTGGGWREYSKTGMISGVKLPDNLKKDSKFSTPIITPTTKAEIGHDESITIQEIIDKKLVSEKHMRQIEDISIRLFNRGQEIANKNGLILVDTKYEFGLDENNNLVLADEIHTSDSSRYWYLKNYLDSFNKGENQKGLDKEYFREWLMANGFNGDGTPPQIPLEVITGICQRYMEGYEAITGLKFIPEAGDYSTSLNNAFMDFVNSK